MSNPKPPAVFVSGDEQVHADRCLPLEQAAASGALTMRAFSRRAYPGKRLPDDRLTEVCTVGWWDARHRQDWGLDWHFNEGIEFTYLEAGALNFGADDQSWCLQPGDLTITRPWQRHRVGDPQVTPSRLFWFILDVGVRHPHTDWSWPEWVLLSPSELARLTNRLRGNETPVVPAASALATHFQSLAQILSDSESLPETRFKIWANQVLLELEMLLELADRPLDNSLLTVERTVKMVLNTVAACPEREWTLDSMAREASTSRSRFGDCCRRVTNRTPMDFLAQSRIDRAVELLRSSPALSVADVAKACGFHSAQYFCNQFKRRLGQSPKAWLAANQ